MNLQLVFQRRPDAIYLAGVDVRIADPLGGEVLRLPASAPLLFVQLRPGSYQVGATVDGKSIKRKVQVPAVGMHTEFIHWRDASTAGAPR